MNRQEKRSFGSKVTSTQFASILNQLEGKLNQANQKAQTLDQDIDTMMTIQMSNPVAEGQEIQKFDMLSIGFLGRLKNEDGSLAELPFQGGVSQYMLLRRFDNGEFIPGFEAGMLGMKVGDVRNISVKFPENYHAADLKGKEVDFEVVVIAGWRLRETASHIDNVLKTLFEAKAKKDEAAKLAAAQEANPEATV